MALINRLVPWIIGAFVLTVALGALYLTMQQVERLGADDAGGRLASAVVADGTDEGAAVGAVDRVDIATNDGVFYVVYDAEGRAVEGNGYEDGRLATIPVGVVKAAMAMGTNRVTWETPDGRRFASIELRSGDHVIMAAQSLAPAEQRIDRIGILLLAGWGLSIVILAVGAFFHVRIARDFD